MATKPNTTFIHATDEKIASGPAEGLPTKVIPPTMEQGFVPGQGISARMVNWLFNVVGQWIGWLNSGTSKPEQDAHIVETDSVGKTSVAGLVAGGTSANFRAIFATANTGAGVSAMDVANTDGSALQCSSQGEPATIVASNNGAGPAISALGSVTVFGPLTVWTHVAADWRGDFRPSSRTFAVSGQTPGQFGTNVDIPITTATTGSKTQFSRPAKSQIVAFEVSLSLVIGGLDDPEPDVSDLAYIYHARWDTLATLNDGNYTAVKDGSVAEVSDGLAVNVTCSTVVSDSNLLIRVAIGENNAHGAPYRIVAEVRQRQVTVAGP